MNWIKEFREKMREDEGARKRFYVVLGVIVVIAFVAKLVFG